MLKFLCYLYTFCILVEIYGTSIFYSSRYECVNEPWNVTTANIVACPDVDDQGRTLYCHTFTQQIKGNINFQLLSVLFDTRSPK